MSTDPRDHGLPNDSEPIGSPTVATAPISSICPCCGCNTTFGIKVPLFNNDLGKCEGFYRGCAACEWASAMEVRPLGNSISPEDYEKLS